VFYYNVERVPSTKLFRDALSRNRRPPSDVLKRQPRENAKSQAKQSKASKAKKRRRDNKL